MRRNGVHDSRLIRGVMGDLIAMELEPVGAYLSAVDAGHRDVDATQYRRLARYALSLLRRGAGLEQVRQCARRWPALAEMLEGLELGRALRTGGASPETARLVAGLRLPREVRTPPARAA